MAPVPRTPVSTPPPRIPLDPAALQRMAQICAKRLRYAHFKVQNGWAKQTLAEVENLYYKQHSYPHNGDVFGPYTSVAPPTSAPMGTTTSTPLPRSRAPWDHNVLTTSSAAMSNRVLGDLYRPTGFTAAHQDTKRACGPQGYDNMSLLAQASMMAPPASTSQLTRESTSLRTPPRRSAPMADALTPSPAEVGPETQDTQAAPAWSALTSTPITNTNSHTNINTNTIPNTSTNTFVTPAPRGSVAASGALTSATPSGSDAAPSNYAAFWAHVGSMGGLGSSTPSDPRKRLGRPSVPPAEADETPLKRIRLAGV